MGQLSKKFVIAPDLVKLLQTNAREKKEHYQLWKEREEAREVAQKKAKEEEKETKLPPPTASAKKLGSKSAGPADITAQAPPVKKPLVTGRARGRPPASTRPIPGSQVSSS